MACDKQAGLNRFYTGMTPQKFQKTPNFNEELYAKYKYHFIPDV